MDVDGDGMHDPMYIYSSMSLSTGFTPRECILYGEFHFGDIKIQYSSYQILSLESVFLTNPRKGLIRGL